MRVAVQHVHALLDAIEHLSEDSPRFLERAGLTEERLASSSGWIELAEYERLLSLALEHTGDPAFGLHWGERGTLLQYDVVTHLVCCAPTLRQAFGAIIRFHGLLSTELELALLEQGDTAWLECHVRGSSPECIGVRTEVSLVGFARMLRMFAGQAGAARRIELGYPAPRHRDEYVRLLGGAVEFGRPRTAIELDRALLDQRHLGGNVEIFRTVEKQAEALLFNLQRGVRHAERVLRCLEDAGPGAGEMEDVARALGTSVRSLRRHLAAEGVSFADLVARAQANIAERLLRDAARTIEAVAYDMGFSSASAFHRAFRRWTGQTPMSFRRALSAGG